MQEFADLTRHYDFLIYRRIYDLSLHSEGWERFFHLFAQYGIVIFLLSFTYLIWMKRINAFLCSFLAMGIGGISDLLIFMFWRRPRPFISHGDVISLPTDKFLYERMSSFPSSHTYIVFAIAVSIYLYGHKKLGIFLMVCALLVAFGRIGTGLHYPSDTIGGAILGTISGIIAFNLVKHNEDKWEYSSNDTK